MYQKITLVGNLGQDPELRYTPSGQAVCNMTVATDQRYTNSEGERVEKTTWFRVTVWGNQAENCNEYLSKGRQIMVEGRLIADEHGNPKIWERNDGSPAASFEINAQTVRFLGGPGPGQSHSAGQNSSGEEDEIPF